MREWAFIPECVAMCCSVLQCVAVWCSVLQCVCSGNDLSYAGMSHGTCMKKSCCSFEWVMLCIPLCHVAVMLRVWARHCATRLIYMRAITQSSVWHDSFMFATWLIHEIDMKHSHVCPDAFVYVTWLMCMCDRTHWYVRHDSFKATIWFINICYMTYPCIHTYIHKYIHIESTRSVQGGEDP